MRLTVLILICCSLIHGQTVLGGSVSGAAGLSAASEPLLLQLSQDGTYLQSQAGSPFFLNGDTAWSAIVQLSTTEMDTYLEDRASKGFNFTLVNLIEANYGDNAPDTYDSISPFTGATFSTPNETYFARADTFIQKAETNGIVVLLAPIYLGFDCGTQGWCPDVTTASTSTMRTWGQYVGNRYKDFPNIIWLIGGDTNPSDHTGIAAKTEEVALGIRDNDTVHLITAHNAPENSARDEWDGKSWLDLNNVYSYNITTMSTEAVTEYNLATFMPVFLIETRYENEQSVSNFSVRRAAWHSVLYGATLGHLFGNCPIWHFDAPTGSGFCSVGGGWTGQLDSTSSTQLPLIGTLMQSRRFWLMAPDQTHTVLTAGYESADTFAATSHASDNSSMISYIPDSRQVTVDMTEFNGNDVHCWWYNPRAGGGTEINTFSGTGTQNFTPPDNNDWVLVCDDDTLGFGEPGT